MALTALSGATAVVTGASSGIGRATARELARRGANVVVAARREEALRATAAECAEHNGGGALAVVTDVSDEDAVRRLGARAQERFGGFDLWVNNAGVYLVAPFESTPADAFRRVVEIDFLGTVNGCRVALEHFRARGHGVLVNVASRTASYGARYTSAYTASKWAVRGLGQVLRQDLVDLPDVHACTVLPAAIDTPLYQHAANYTGRSLTALPRPSRPEQVAEAIAGLAVKPRPETNVGGGGAVALAHRVAPRAVERILAAVIDRVQFGSGRQPPGPGNLFEPDARHTGASGGWRG